jgi:hypothetical protein
MAVRQNTKFSQAANKESCATLLQNSLAHLVAAHDATNTSRILSVYAPVTVPKKQVRCHLNKRTCQDEQLRGSIGEKKNVRFVNSFSVTFFYTSAFAFFLFQLQINNNKS